MKCRNFVNTFGKDFEKSYMRDEDCEELYAKAASMIRMCLAKNVLANVFGIAMAKDL